MPSPTPDYKLSSSVKVILDAVMDELGLLRPSGYVGAADIQTRQMVALFHGVGDYLVNCQPWQELVAYYQFITEPEVFRYNLPPFWSGMVDETAWNAERKVRVYGRNLQDWIRLGTINWRAPSDGNSGHGGQYVAKQIAQNALFLEPTPTVAETIHYYFYSGAWVVHPLVASTDRCLADDDMTRWGDDRMMILGTKAFWLRSKRLSYDEEWSQFQERIRTQFIAGQDNERFSIDPAVPVPGSYPGGGGGLVVPAGNWGV